MDFNSRVISSLEKVFLTSDINTFAELYEEKIFKNQKYSFQIACRFEGGWQKTVRPIIEGDLAPFVTLREVVNIPSEFPTYPNCSDMPEMHTPGLYPDLLRPLKYDGVLRFLPMQSRAFWIDVNPNCEIVGKHTLKIKIMDTDFSPKGFIDSDRVLGEHEIKIDIKDIMLPDQTLMFTQWFYADCLADYYNVDVFSDRHFEICENFARVAVENGRNMLMLPLLTYALDTRYGGERTTVQLIDVYKDGESYTFQYDNLDRWLDMYKRIGVKYYEICPIFSQWGAENTPKVMAVEKGELKQIFGWGTNPISKEYNTFIRAFLTGFIEHMKLRGEDKKCWYHVSDEPVPDQMKQYKAVRNSVSDLLDDYNCMDAISHYEFYEMGIIKTPVPKTIGIEPFIENNVPDLWCYYCGSQCEGVSNCHFAMPLSRVRSLGFQMFKYDIKGFLHWGYNFYNNMLSHDHVDPFLCSDGESFVASGDTYMVYPAPDGTAWESTRLRALYEGMEDMRAMQLAEKLCGKQAVVGAIEKLCGEIKFSKCVNDADLMLSIRRTVNQMVFDNM